MLFKVSELEKSYGGESVLKGVTFQINAGEKVGLVGRNGAGKTTVFRMITGDESPDSGSVEKINGLRLGLLEQHVDFETEETVHTAALSAFQRLHDIEAEMRVLEARMANEATEDLLSRYADLQIEFESNGGFEYTARAEAILLGMGFSKESWISSTSTLSGGQKNRLGMVRLLLSDSDVLLLDEPTNHLDVGAVEWLEDFLRERDSASVVISHDRYFLDRTCSRIVEIENGRAYSYAGNYSSYLVQAELRREQQAREYENQRAYIAKTEAFIRKNLAGQKTKQAKSRRNMLERLDRVDAPVAETHGGSFAIKDVQRAGTNVLTVEEMSVGYAGKALVAGMDLDLLRGDRLGVIGGNGTGKTTFLRTLLGEIRPLTGSFRWGAKTEIGYYSQQLEGLEPNNDVFSEFRRVAPLADNKEIRSFLARFLFFGEDVFKRVSDLSGGEKGRLSLAKLVHSGANVLLLDEPTNHLDIPAREALEEALIEFPGTLIVVSHDRFFLDRIANRILDLNGPRVAGVFPGNYTEYHERAVSDSLPKNEKALEVVEAADRRESNDIPSANLSKNERRRMSDRISEIEEQIPEMESELASISHRMSEPGAASDSGMFAALSREFSQKEEQIREIYREWEDLLEKLA